jgi:hypothetical protein
MGYCGAGPQMGYCKVTASTAGQAQHQGSDSPSEISDSFYARRPVMTTGKAEQKSLDTPDETRTFERGALHLVRVGGGEIGRLTLQPGWRWSEHVKPLAGTDLCEAPHFQYHVQGTLHIVMADGVEFDARPGDVTALPEGHDAWVVGDEPVVIVDWYGASNYARS